MAETKIAAEAAFDAFIESYEWKYAKPLEVTSKPTDHPPVRNRRRLALRPSPRIAPQAPEQAEKTPQREGRSENRPHRGRGRFRPLRQRCGKLP